MDTWGFVLIVVFGIIFLATRNKPERIGWHKFSIFGLGAGAGFLIGVYGAYSVVMSILP